MGQRLNIEIRRRKDNEVLANCYYHWSAYTESSLNLAKEIISNLFSILHNETSDRIKAIQLLQSSGGGLIEEEYNELDNEDKKYCHIGLNRNLGLISFTKKGIEETRKYEESRLTIDIDFDDIDNWLCGNCYIDFGVVMPIEKEEIDELIENNKLKLDKIVEFDFDLQNMNINDISIFIDKIKDIEKNCGLFKIKKDNLIYQIIY